MHEVKNLDFGLLDQIKACHLNSHSLKTEIDVVRTFGDIEVQNWLFHI